MSINKVGIVANKTLLTGTTTMQVFTRGPTEVEISGTFGSVLLGSSTQPTLSERTIVAAERFRSDMTDMLFTLTGAGPVVIKITTLEGNNYIASE